MIARIWRGITLKEKADDYLAYLHETGLRDYAKTPGNRGVTILRRNQGEHCEVMLISLWESMDAVRAFAGENPDRSVYYPEDEHFLLQMEPLVRHYDVAEQIGPTPRAQPTRPLPRNRRRRNGSSSPLFCGCGSASKEFQPLRENTDSTRSRAKQRGLRG